MIPAYTVCKVLTGTQQHKDMAVQESQQTKGLNSSWHVINPEVTRFNPNQNKTFLCQNKLVIYLNRPITTKPEKKKNCPF